MAILRIDKLIRQIFESPWRSPERLENIIRAGCVESLASFLYPYYGYSKSFWEVGAQVLFLHPDEDLYPYLEAFLFWNQDINWPGEDLIEERISELKRNDAYYRVLEKCKIYAELYPDKCMGAIVRQFEETEGVQDPGLKEHNEEHYEDFLGAVPAFRETRRHDDICDVDIIIDMLRSSNSEACQAEGMRLAGWVRHYIAFNDVLWRSDKADAKANCAKVIAARRDEEFGSGPITLFRWLRDDDPVCREIIYDKLLNFPNLHLHSHLFDFLLDIFIRQAGAFQEAGWQDALLRLRQERKAFADKSGHVQALLYRDYLLKKLTVFPCFESGIISTIDEIFTLDISEEDILDAFRTGVTTHIRDGIIKGILRGDMKEHLDLWKRIYEIIKDECSTKTFDEIYASDPEIRQGIVWGDFGQDGQISGKSIWFDAIEFFRENPSVEKVAVLLQTEDGRRMKDIILNDRPFFKRYISESYIHFLELTENTETSVLTS